MEFIKAWFWVAVCCTCVNVFAEQTVESEQAKPEQLASNIEQQTLNTEPINISQKMPVLEPADVMIAEISDAISMGASKYLQSVFKQAEERGASEVVILLDAKRGSYKVSIDMMQAVDAFPGQVHAYVGQEAIGPAALVLMACDSVYVAKTAILGDASAYDEGSEDAMVELSDYLKAQARSYVAEVPFRNDLIRAVTERDFEWQIGDDLIKSKDKFLILTGKEAAMRYAYEGADEALLATDIFANADLMFESVFKDKVVAEYVDVAVQSEPQMSEDATDTAEVGELVGDVDVFIVPIEGPIDTPQLYILRRALKEAIANNVEVVVLDMDTPGGRLDVMFEMMEALDRFEGMTITYINEAAISAGSYIAIASNEIYFAPQGVMGAAAAIQGTGEDIPPTLKAKIDSITQAKVRALTSEHPYRADVQRAMSDASFEFKLDGHIISPKGELLSLTADEALEEYGYPPTPLVSSGTRSSTDELLDKRFGADNYTIKAFEVSWSETFSKWFNSIAPLLMGVGVLLMFIEFKTPNFGIIGGIGIFLILLVFASNYFAGMAGYEEILVFALGVIFIAVELFLFPGTIVFGVTGLLMIFGSLLWALADIWPSRGGGIDWDPTVFYGPALQVALGLVITFVGLAIVWRYLPNTWIWKKMVLSTAVSDGGATSGSTAQSTSADKPSIGSRGVAVTDMFPSGEIEIEGRRYQARSKVGSIQKSEDIEVVEYGSFGLIVAKIG